MGEVCEINPKIPNRLDISDELEIQFLPMKLVEEETGKIHLIETRKFGEVKKGYTPFIDQDVLFAKVTPCMENGKIALVDGLKNGIGFGSSEFHVFRSIKDVNPNYLFNFLVQKRTRSEAENSMTGAVGLRRVPKQFLENYDIPLPPLPVQHAIVTKIEEIFSELDHGVEQLKVARAQLKVYRQAVLKWAFEGRLTNEGVMDGELPEGWKWVKLGELADKIFDGPFGSNLKSSDYVEAGVRVIRLENIGVLEFKDEYQTFVSEEKYSTIQRHTVTNGDIIFSSFIMGETRVTVLPKFIKKAINKADCFCIRTMADKISENYLTYYLSTKALYNQLADEVHGATRPRINTTQLKSCMIPYCPISEQHQIVSEIERRLSVCDKLEETIEAGLKQAEVLRAGVLKMAFEGRLV